MGTAKESNINRDEEDEDEIPWKFVPRSVRQELIVKLNPNATMSGNDWRMLASELLGYNSSQINFIESDKGNNTTVLFSQYDAKPEASFNAVRRALVKMKRQDCLQILKDAESEIKQAYIRAQESHIYHTAETTDGLLHSGGHYSWSNPACPCTYSPHPTAACGSHGYCGHGFASCVCASHSHHLGHPLYHYHPIPPHPCQALSHTDTPQQSCPPSLSSPKEQISCHDRITRPTPYGYHENSSASRMPVNHILNHQGQAVTSPGHLVYPVSSNYKYNDSGNSSSLINTEISNCSETFNNGQKIIRQYSDDCNVLSKSNTNKRFRNDGSNDIGGSQQDTSVQGFTGHDTSGMEKPRNNHSPRFDHHFSAADANYRHYKDRCYMEEDKVKVENIESEQNMDSPPNSSASLWDRSHQSSTFPIRVKAKQNPALENLKHLNISKKSTSMPQNMKPAQYRKVFRHIKVFVTYSYDNDTHAKRVLSLCKFLQDNGFACCVDVSERDNCGKQLEWCRRKVAEADFILVCISNKYLEDIAQDRQNSTATTNGHPLHTREIYKLIKSNQHNSSDDNGGSSFQPCLIPLLFPDMTEIHIPHWMKNGPTYYYWPGQYKDLAWMLTKPQERIKAKKESQDGRGSDSEGAVGGAHVLMDDIR